MGLIGVNNLCFSYWPALLLTVFTTDNMATTPAMVEGVVSDSKPNRVMTEVTASGIMIMDANDLFGRQSKTQEKNCRAGQVIPVRKNADSYSALAVRPRRFPDKHSADPGNESNAGIANKKQGSVILRSGMTWYFIACRSFFVILTCLLLCSNGEIHKRSDEHMNWNIL